MSGIEHSLALNYRESLHALGQCVRKAEHEVLNQPRGIAVG